MPGGNTIVIGNARHKRNPSGQKKVFVKAEQKFYLQFRMTDPADPAKLVDFPEGITVRLMNDGKTASGPGAVAKTDASGKVVLSGAKSQWQAKNWPSYHFRIDLDERTFYDIDAKKLAAGDTIKESDQRNLMELPMVMDTKNNDFHYDKAKLPLDGGMLKKYPVSKKGEGSPSGHVVLELKLYWYYLRFKFYDTIREDVQGVPRGMPVIPMVDGKDHLARMVKDEAASGYALNSDEKRALHYLKLLAFFKGRVDKPVEKDVKDALKKFQKQHGLTENGTLDGPTKGMLEHVFFCRNTGIYKDGAYWVPVWKKKGEAITEVFFELARPVNKLVSGDDSASFDLFLFTKDKTSAPVMVTRKKIAQDNKDKDGKEVPYEKLDFLKARHYYDLPVKWSSRNYWTRYDNDMNKGERFSVVMKDKVTLYPFVADEAKRQDKSKPLVFSFDDIVLVKADGSQDIQDKDAGDTDVVLKADAGAAKDGSRLTLFKVENGNLVVHDLEEADRPYFSKVTAASANFTANVIPNAPGNTRLVAFAGDFYDATNRRTAQKAEPFDRTKHVLGARAAMLNDPDCHCHKAFKDPKTPYAADGTGHFELHYVHNAWPISGPDRLTIRSFLLVHWSGRFESAAAPNNVTADKVKKYETEGMENAKKRWEDKVYAFEPLKLATEGGDCTYQIRPVFFFEAKKPGIGGKAKCTVKISGDEDAGSMGLESSTMYWKDYQVNDYQHLGAFADVDGKSYEALVVAHELGHAKGKDDDYAYSTKFKQYYPGMPYQFDVGSMMKSNRAPRMRHLYNILNWINNSSKDPGGLKKFQNSAQFTLVHRFGKTVLRYVMPDASKDIYVPYKVKAGHALSQAQTVSLRSFDRMLTDMADRMSGSRPPTHAVDLSLYRLGKDETGYSYAIGGRKPRPPKAPFDAILVVYVKIGIKFIDGSDGNWTNATKRDFRNGLSNVLKTLNERFYLESSGVLKRTYLAVFPVCLEKDPVDPESHYDLEVYLDGTSEFGERSGKKAQVGNEVSKHWLAKYILCSEEGHFSTAFRRLLGNWSLGSNDLKFARDWMRGELNDSSIVIRDTLW